MQDKIIPCRWLLFSQRCKRDVSRENISVSGFGRGRQLASIAEPPSPADDDAAALRVDCAAVSCDSPSASQSERERTYEKVSPPTPPPTESESKATQEVLTREDLLGKKISYAGGHAGMRAKEDEEVRWRLRSERQRQRYEAWLAAKRTKIPDDPKASSDDSSLAAPEASPAQPPGAATPHKSDSSSNSDAVSAPKGSTAKSTQKQDPDDVKTTRRATGLRRTKSAR